MISLTNFLITITLSVALLVSRTLSTYFLTRNLPISKTFNLFFTIAYTVPLSHYYNWVSLNPSSCTQKSLLTYVPASLRSLLTYFSSWHEMSLRYLKQISTERDFSKTSQKHLKRCFFWDIFKTFQIHF